MCAKEDAKIAVSHTLIAEGSKKEIFALYSLSRAGLCFKDQI